MAFSIKQINKPFNPLQKEAYWYFRTNHRQYSGFNTLGWYRSFPPLVFSSTNLHFDF